MTKNLKTQFIFLWVLTLFSVVSNILGIASVLLSIAIIFQLYRNAKPNKLNLIDIGLFIILIIFCVLSMIIPTFSFGSFIVSIIIYVLLPTPKYKYTRREKVFIVIGALIAVGIAGSFPSKELNVSQGSQQQALQSQNNTKKDVLQKKEKPTVKNTQLSQPLNQTQAELTKEHQAIAQQKLQQEQQKQEQQAVAQQKQAIHTQSKQYSNVQSSNIGTIDHYADIHSEPNSHSTKKGFLKYGDSVTIVSKNKDYYYITSNEGNGYVYENFIRK